MDAMDISIQERKIAGKSAIRNLKNFGMLPGVLYNYGQGIPISLEDDEIRDVLNKYGTNVLLNVNFKGNTFRARVKEIQRDPVNQEIKHIDLMPLENNTGLNYLH